jgi:hypothetical protein
MLKVKVPNFFFFFFFFFGTVDFLLHRVDVKCFRAKGSRCRPCDGEVGGHPGDQKHTGRDFGCLGVGGIAER